MNAELDRLVEFFATLNPQSLPHLREIYAADASFRDPFNDVRGVAAIERIFADMFARLDRPRFVITGTYAATDGGPAAMLLWDFSFASQALGGEILIRGSTHLVFDASGRVASHRDYWDAGEEIYGRVPVLGSVVRLLRRRMAAD